MAQSASVGLHEHGMATIPSKPSLTPAGYDLQWASIDGRWSSADRPVDHDSFLTHAPKRLPSVFQEDAVAPIPPVNRR